jgi:hypothetical protein
VENCEPEVNPPVGHILIVHVYETLERYSGWMGGGEQAANL